MAADDRERDQRLGVLLAWGVFGITLLATLPLLVHLGGDPFAVLLFGALVVVLAKVSADAWASDRSPSGPESEEFRLAGDPVGASGDDAVGAERGEDADGVDRGDGEDADADRPEDA